MKRTRIISLLLTLALTAALLVTPAAAAGAAPRLTVSSQEAQNSQTVGFTGLPADCQSLQVTLHLSDEIRLISLPLTQRWDGPASIPPPSRTAAR